MLVVDPDHTYAAPGRRSSAMWLSLLVSRGMSLVAGRENFKLFFKRGLCCKHVDCNECIVRGI
jgi:hypothetical protein